MILSLLLLLVGVCEATVVPSFMAKELLTQLHLDIATMTASAFPQQRKLAYTINFDPRADPAFVCKSFQDASQGQYECACDYAPDKSVRLKCIDVKGSCNEDGSFCFKQNINMGMTTENVIKEIESCTKYDTNFTRFEGSSTKAVNYTEITPCVKVFPKTVGDFSSLESCSATINELPCYKCEICNDNAPALGITLDCCNATPNRTQLKVNCGLMGGGGAFAPQFETWEEGEMEQCSGVSRAATISLGVLSSFVVSLFVIV